MLPMTLLVSAALFAGPRVIEVKPGESVKAVLDKVRAIPPGEKARGVELVFAAGEWVLSDGLVLTAADCGVAGAPVTWRAAKPGATKFTGAGRVPVSAFSKVVDESILSRIPAEARGKVYWADVSAFCPGKKVPSFKNAFSGLYSPPVVFMDGRVADLARWPNGNDWAVFTNRVDRGIPLEARERYRGGAFAFSDPRAKRWDFSKGVWLNGYFTHDWFNWSAKAVSFGVEGGTNDIVRFDDQAHMPYGVMSGTWGRKERRFRAFNLLEELDEPGEWWLDRETLRIYLIPPGGEMKADTDIRIAFSSKPLLSAKNIANLRIEGLSFEYNYGPFVSLWGADDVTISNCTFFCTGQGAVTLSGSRSGIVGCEIAHCGAGGASLYGGDRKTLVPANSRIENCRIHDFGIFSRTYAGGACIQGCGLVLRGCEIWDAPHAAVFFSGNEHLLESNDVHHVLLETGDAGAFYIGRDWTMQGNVLRYNYVHDLGAGTSSSSDGADMAVTDVNTMGFYFDDCECGDTVYGNVFSNIGRGILIGGGRDHPIRGNVFINCRIGMSIDCRGMTWKNWNVPGGSWDLESKAKKFDYTNGVWAARYPRLARIMEDHPKEPLYNPVEDNVFIDCRIPLQLGREAPLERMAPIRNNTVVNTGAMEVPANQIDKRVKEGFRVIKRTGAGSVELTK